MPSSVNIRKYVILISEIHSIKISKFNAINKLANEIIIIAL